MITSAIALAEKAVNAQPDSDQFLNTLGAVLYRAGRHEDAIERLAELDRRRETADGTAESSPAYTWYFLAMAHKKAGNDEQAQEYLKKATKRTDEVLADKENPRPGTAKSRWRFFARRRRQPSVSVTKSCPTPIRNLTWR